MPRSSRVSTWPACTSTWTRFALATSLTPAARQPTAGRSIRSHSTVSARRRPRNMARTARAIQGRRWHVHDYAPGLEQAFELDFQEATYPIHNIEGRVPSFVRGRYYVNGPAGFCNGPFRYRHWLDGDGMVCALRFDAGQVHFTSAFVRSTKFRVESEVRRPVFRAFGTTFPGDRLKRGIATESPINVS